MRTRRDQVQAYRFVTRRVVSALLSGEPEAVERPMRRLGLSVFASTMVAALVVAAAGIWGLVTGQGRDLDDNEPILVIERDTHAPYVYVDGVLHPVVNLTSARLILGTPTPTRRDNVPRSTLRDLPRGETLGIPGAPHTLPDDDELVGLPWRLCSVPPTGDSSEPETTLVLGDELADGSNLGEEGLYVAVGDTPYLLWDDRLLQITHQVAPVALGLSAAQPTQIGSQLVNAVTTGPDLDVIRPEGFDEPADFEIRGQQAYVGHIYLTAGQHYVMTREGLRPLGELTVALRTSIGAAQVRDITGNEVTRFQHSSDPLEPPGYPLQVPEIHPASGQSPTVCATYRGAEDDSPAVTIEIFNPAPDRLDPSITLRPSDRDTVAAADRLRLPPGRAALVQAASTTGAATAGGTVYLVTEEGRKFPIGSNEARQALGYGDVEPHPVPIDLLELIPTGSTLDTEAARQVAGPTTGPELDAGTG